MQTRKWQDVALAEGVLSEPTQGEDRIVVWLFGGREEGFFRWERISNVARAETITETGVCTTPATAIVARRRERAGLGKLFSGLRRSSGDRSWTLPNGDTAEQVGERRTDLVLAWADDDALVLDDAALRTRLPAAETVRKIGENLFVVFGVETKRPAPEPELPAGTPREEAERILAAARQGGDRRR